MQTLIRACVVMFVAILAFSFAVVAQSSSPTLFRQLAISKTDIAFSYAGDLWIVSRNGGDARRLTTGIGIETNPYFSPDGNWTVEWLLAELPKIHQKNTRGPRIPITSREQV